jgi:HlyD family secretion protein
MNHVMDRPIRPAWWRNKYWTWLVVVTGMVLLGIVTATTFQATSSRALHMPLVMVTIARVTRGTFHDFVPLKATVTALDTTYLDALEGGRVERILAQAGDEVVAGQPLVELSNTELELDVLDREGRLIESITQLQAYQTQLEQNRINNQKALAQIDYNIVRLGRSLGRRTQLAAKGLEPVETRDTVQDELSYDLKLQPMQAQSNQKQEELRLRQLPQIQSQIEKLQADLRITHSKLDNLTVRASVGGLLTSLDLKVGENRNRGDRFAEITPNTGYKLSAAVDEYYLRRVRVGRSATVEVGDKAYHAVVTRLYPQVKDGTFSVDLAFDQQTPSGLLSGQTVQGKLSLGEDAAGLLLPAGAFLERTGGDWVFVLGSDRASAQRRRIKVGRRNADQVEILGGLRPGDEVIISDYTGLEGIDRIELSR